MPMTLPGPLGKRESLAAFYCACLCGRRLVRQNSVPKEGGDGQLAAAKGPAGGGAGGDSLLLVLVPRPRCPRTSSRINNAEMRPGHADGGGSAA